MNHVANFPITPSKIKCWLEANVEQSFTAAGPTKSQYVAPVISALQSDCLMSLESLCPLLSQPPPSINARGPPSPIAFRRKLPLEVRGRLRSRYLQVT